LPHLTADEAALYRDLVEDVFGTAVRLEQERISYPRIAAAVDALS
jgi:Wadjet protein JetD, C-terminal